MDAAAATVIVDASRFPGRARAAYLESFRTRRMNHQFHYDTEKQAHQWLALHEAYSPARRETACSETYSQAFAEIARLLQTDAVVSLGCGGGQKDLALLKALGGNVLYLPADVSLPLALTAHLAAEEAGILSRPAVLDLGAIDDLRGFLSEMIPDDAIPLFAFFGMLPNFEPAEIIPLLAGAVGPAHCLVLSANLAPGGDYQNGVRAVLPQYDNPLTRRWLATVLLDAGVPAKPEDLEYEIVAADGLLRIEVAHRFRVAHSIRMDGEEFRYEAGERFRLFFSYRHTAETLRSLLEKFGLEMIGQWIAPSQEEGIFLCRKRAT